MDAANTEIKLSALVEAIEHIAPLAFAEPWDNVGLLVGDPLQRVAKVLLTIDYTDAVAREGEAGGFDTVIAYHPTIFAALKRIDPFGTVHDAIRRGVAIYSPHTALDAAPGGSNDVLCDVLGVSSNRRPLKPVAGPSDACKLVTFVPAASVEQVSRAMFSAGAGRIGNYSSCSFRAAGTGTFFGEAGTRPATGERGQLEETPEFRLETIVPLSKVAQVTAAIRDSHPYEEVAIDLIPLARVPGNTGMGRFGILDAPVSRQMLLKRIKSGLGLPHLLVAGPTAGDIDRVAVCAGAGGGDLFEAALAQGAQLYLTGELRHHDALRAAAGGMTVVCTLHSNSERITLAALRKSLALALPQLSFELSSADRDPFAVC